jgi:hypothetical protein
MISKDWKDLVGKGLVAVTRKDDGTQSQNHQLQHQCAKAHISRNIPTKSHFPPTPFAAFVFRVNWLHIIFKETFRALRKGAIAFVETPFVETVAMHPLRRTAALARGNHRVRIVVLQTDTTCLEMFVFGLVCGERIVRLSLHFLIRGCLQM